MLHLYGSLFRCTLAALLVGLVLAPRLEARVEGEAVVGEPFGVARITVDLSDRDQAALDLNSIRLQERDGRAHYPAKTQGTVRRLLANLLADESSSPSVLTIYFLFSGEAPLHLQLDTSPGKSLTLDPVRTRPLAFQRLLRAWWREYNAEARRQVESSDYPALVETYLTSMLGQRLGLEPPLLDRLAERDPGQLRQTLELLLGVEELRTETLRQTMLGRNRFSDRADRPVPEPLDGAAPEAPRIESGDDESADDESPVDESAVDIEAIAAHVPQECFYIRYGSFANYLWLSHLTKEFGGDLSRMIKLRGHDAQLHQRMQDQIALKQTKIGELLGGNFIADVAMIGRDFYLREGAAFGMLFQAKNPLLGNEFQRQRNEALQENKEHGAKIETVAIKDHEVSFLSTPDFRLRSYYAVDGDFHLVTTSHRMVERFFEAGSGEAALGDSLEFRHARSLMPTDREDTVFAYFSSAFFWGLVSPQYQIELGRRIQSVTDMELVQLARLAARGERKPAETIEALIAGGFLPQGFGRRSDGSGPVLTSEGVVDSLRGQRGRFTPIPDVSLQAVTREEEQRYARRAAFYQRNWSQMDPLMVGLKRYALDPNGKERIVIEGNISPLAEQKYGWIISILGPPATMQITSAPGDIITAEVSLRGGLLQPGLQTHQLFAGIQNTPAPIQDLPASGFFKVLRILRTTPGYLGAWPHMGLLDLLPFRLGSEPDRRGYSQLLFGLWRRQFEEFAVLSFDPEILAKVTPHLRTTDAEDPAQIRIHAGDLSQSLLKEWIASLNYQRALQTTLGNVRMLHTLTQQLGVAPDQSLDTAERLMDVQLVCSLGGKYELVQSPEGRLSWSTSQLPDGPARRVPDDYQSPVLAWFRGLDARLTKTDGRLMLYAQVDMQRSQPETRIQLPTFNLFGSQGDDAKGRAAEPSKPSGREF